MRLPLLNIILLLLVTLLVDAYIMWDVRSQSSKLRRGRNCTVYGISVLLCWALLAVGLSLPRRSGDYDLLPVMWLLFSYLTIFVAKIVYVLCSIVGRLVNIGSRRLVNYGGMAGVPLGILVFITMWWGVLVTRHELETVKVEVASARIPKGFDGYRIVQFSDAHVPTWGADTTFVARMVDEINALNADMIVFTGDLANRNTPEIEPFIPVLSRLRAKDGVYSILGNHDYGDYQEWPDAAAKEANLRQMHSAQARMGWQLLDNHYRYIVQDGDTIALIGVGNWGEPPFGQYGDLKKAYESEDGTRNINDKRFKVLLSHNPEHWNRYVRSHSNVDLTLSGHTHAMQMEADMFGRRFSPASWRYPYWGGMYEDKAPDGTPSRLYVNIGTGEVAIPMRIGATPEITVITLKSEKR